MIKESNSRIAAVFIAALLGVPSLASAQSLNGPLSNVVLSGYGSATFIAVPDSDFRNDFTASVSPVILYSMGDDLLFETELEFGLSGELTTTSLEYAQIDYLGFERLQFVAGKFLLPFGTFSERLHPTWINKLPTMPLVYGHAHGGVAEESLLPILSDAGLMARYKAPVGEKWAVDITGWISQGPQLQEHDEEAESEGDPHAHKGGGSSRQISASLSEAEIEIPLVGFGIGFSDNNSNKMLGARIGLVHGPSFEIYFSAFHAMYDPGEYLDLTGFNISIDYRKARFDVRAEVTVLNQELELEDGFDTLSRTGYYIQVARRYGAFEPVVRWSHLLEGKLEGDVLRAERQQIAVGLNYWIEPSVPVKLAYQVGLDGENLILLQWAFGF